MRRHLVIAVIAWALLSAVSMVLAAGLSAMPEVASQEAAIENRTFTVLTVVSMPVLWLVVVGMAYSALRFRARDGEQEDGLPIHGHSALQAGWVLVTFVMVIGLFVYGTVGLVEIRGAQTADFQVEVHAKQWAWEFHYPNGTESKELHVPINRRVHLTFLSDDVIHSMWLPALGVKQDVVPGRTTEAYTTPTVAGTYGGRCAELCGFGHTDMVMTFVVQDEGALNAWLSTLPKQEHAQ